MRKIGAYLFGFSGPRKLEFEKEKEYEEKSKQSKL